MFDLIDPRWIHAASAGEFWFWAAAAWAAAAGGFLASLRFYARARIIEDTPHSLIRSAAQGYIELAGRAELLPGPPITAPLTGTPCVWWAYRIEERSGGGRGRWTTLNRQISDDLFCLRDATGRCVVDPERAEVYPAVKQTWYGDTPEPLRGPAYGGFPLGARYRYVEERIHAGDPLYALGFFHTQGPPSAGDTNEEVRQLLIEWKRNQAALLQRFDANRDGRIDQQEWDAARAEARREVLAQEAAALARPPVNLLSRPADGRPFILSTAAQHKLESRLRRWAAGGLLLFFAAGALGSYLIGERLAPPPEVLRPAP